MEDNLPASLLVFISNLLAIYQLNVFIILLTNLSYARQRQLCLDYVSSSSNDDNIDDNNGNGDENCNDQNHDHNCTNGINNEFWDDFDNSFSDDNYDFDSSQMHIPSVIEAFADDIAEDVHRVVNPDEHAPVPELLTNDGVRSETVFTTMNAMPENGTSTPIDNHAPHHERDAEVSTTEGELATPVTNSCTCTSQKEPESSKSLRHFLLKFFESQVTPKRKVTGKQKQLIGFGESMTNEEAMERARKEEEKRNKREREKEERKKQREEKR